MPVTVTVCSAPASLTVTAPEDSDSVRSGLSSSLMVAAPVSVVTTFACVVVRPTVKVSVDSWVVSSTVFTVKVFCSPLVPENVMAVVFSV